MAKHQFSELQERYENFKYPIVVINVNNKNIAGKDSGLVVNDIDIDLSSGYEASIASFHIYNSFNVRESKYLFDSIKDFIAIGSNVSISAGYSKNTTASPPRNTRPSGKRTGGSDMKKGIVWILLLLLLTGCGRQSAPQVSELDIWVTSQERGDVYEALAQCWNEENPQEAIRLTVSVSSSIVKNYLHICLARL